MIYRDMVVIGGLHHACSCYLLNLFSSHPALYFIFQVQNLALHCASRAVAVKSELPERKDVAGFPLGQQQQQQNFAQRTQQQQVQPQQQQQMAKPNFAQQSTANTMTVKTGNQAAMTVTPAASVAPSSTSSPALPLSQLLLSSSAAPVILVPTTNVPTTTQGYSIGSVTQKANINTQTLVVQPLQQASTTADKVPVPIQPKTAQGHRLPVQLPPRHPPPILPAPPGNSQGTPHIPVQLVGARQGLAGNAQAVALAQVRSSTGQETTGNVNAVSSNSAMVRASSERMNLSLLCWIGVKIITSGEGILTVFPPIFFHKPLDKACHWFSEEKI